MFITLEDYRVVIGDNAFRAIAQLSEENLDNAQLEAQEEIAGYLRPTYDTDAIFAAEGDDRNRLIVMYTCDIALYHLSASLPQKMGSEIREERYKRAIEWLEGVQAGKIVPDLPAPSGADELADAQQTVWNSQPRLRHNW